MTRSRLMILYGSQTGQAESISHEIYDRCKAELDLADHGIEVAIYPLEYVGRKFDIEKETVFVFVVSTTGEGEPPDNALKFWRRIKKKTLPSDYLAHLKYALLGLGDSNYNRFANFGRVLDSRIEELGGKKFIATGFGDDAVGLEIGVEPWKDQLFTILPSILNITSIEIVPSIVGIMGDSTKNDGPLFKSSISNLSQLTLPQVSSRFQDLTIAISDKTMTPQVIIPKLPVMESEVYDAEIESIKRLTPNDGDEKIILEATIKSDTKFKVRPGDSFGFYPGNRDDEVNFILDYLGLTEKADLHSLITCSPLLKIPAESTLRHLIKYHLELRSIPKKSFLRHLADYCSNEVERRRLLELSSREGAEDFSSCIRNFHANILDIFKYFPSCKPPLEVLLANIPSFNPRYYSVVNYSSQETDTFKIVFSVFKTSDALSRSGTQNYGVFTGLLYDWIREDERRQTIENLFDKMSIRPTRCMKIFKRKNAHFFLPQDPMIPLILVGPGTGVAPFIGFLEQRKEMREKMKRPLGQTWLFFGSRSSREFIYQDYIQQLEKERVLHRLKVCYSRDESSETKYVQDEIKKNAKEVYEQLSNEEVMIYVCGDMKSMSVRVAEAFTEVLESEGEQMHENAVQKVREMQSKKKYLQDIWT